MTSPLSTSSTTLRLKQVQDILLKGRKHRLTPQDQDDIINAFKDLERDVDLTKRRISNREDFVNRTKVERTELAEQIAEVEQEIYQLHEEISSREESIRKLKQIDKEHKSEIGRLLKEKSEIEAEMNVLRLDNAPLAHCDAVFASRFQDMATIVKSSKTRQSFNRKRTSVQKPVQKSANADNGDNIDYTLSSQDDVMVTSISNVKQKLTELCASARSSISVMTQSFTCYLFSEALAVAAQRGVNVRVLMDADWLDSALRASTASRDHQAWNSIYRKFKLAGVQWGVQCGRRYTSRPSSTHVPFTHNNIIIDSTMLITGALKFADDYPEFESSLFVIHGNVPDAVPGIQRISEIFENMWANQVTVDAPQEVTRIRLPRI
eukprot:gene4753-6835_t